MQDTPASTQTNVCSQVYLQGPALRSLGEAGWCGREDSNFHGVAPTATSTLRVYHSATAAHSVEG
jgi:hypothetical protein